MNDFDADWLDLREAVDAQSRAPTFVDALRAHRSETGLLRVLDLGTGTGSNPRYLAPRLGGSQDWLVADKDAGLLGRLPRAVSAWAVASGWTVTRDEEGIAVVGAKFRCRFRPMQLDLRRELDRLPLSDRHLVTASALLDLVSEAWLEGLIERCSAAGVDCLFALTYDGRVRLAPAHRDDAWILGLVDRHQRTDKGFGPALGPAAAAAAERLLEARGYCVRRQSSDWRIGPGQGELQDRLLVGWAEAALQMAPEAGGILNGWLQARQRAVARGLSRLEVGHQDLLGIRE